MSGQKGKYMDDIPRGGTGVVPGHHGDDASAERTCLPAQTPPAQTPRGRDRSLETVRAGSAVAERKCLTR